MYNLLNLPFAPMIKEHGMHRELPAWLDARPFRDETLRQTRCMQENHLNASYEFPHVTNLQKERVSQLRFEPSPLPIYVITR